MKQSGMDHGRVCFRLHWFFPSRTIRPQQSRKTSPIRSNQGKPEQNTFNNVEKTKVPKAAASAPFAVAR